MKNYKIIILLLLLLCLSCGSNKNLKVYITKDGDKYHYKDCSTLKGHKKTAIKLGDAYRKGYRRCKVCDPPALKK